MMMGVCHVFQLRVGAVKKMAFLLFSLALLLPLITSGSVGRRWGVKMEEEEEQMKKMILGSRPPGCVNKCMNCRPCVATLVIPPHSHFSDLNNNNYDHKSGFHSNDEDDDHSYYLVSWKCRCGNKLYQP